jgi:hypothetical protein
MSVARGDTRGLGPGRVQTLGISPEMTSTGSAVCSLVTGSHVPWRNGVFMLYSAAPIGMSSSPSNHRMKAIQSGFSFSKFPSTPALGASGAPREPALLDAVSNSDLGGFASKLGAGSLRILDARGAGAGAGASAELFLGPRNMPGKHVGDRPGANAAGGEACITNPWLYLVVK